MHVCSVVYIATFYVYSMVQHLRRSSTQQIIFHMLFDLLMLMMEFLTSILLLLSKSYCWKSQMFLTLYFSYFQCILSLILSITQRYMIFYVLYKSMLLVFLLMDERVLLICHLLRLLSATDVSHLVLYVWSL